MSALADNLHTQISLPRRHKLNENRTFFFDDSNGGSSREETKVWVLQSEIVGFIKCSVKIHFRTQHFIKTNICVSR